MSFWQAQFGWLMCSRWHRKERRFCPVSTIMTVSIAVTVAMRNISMPLG
jgi:hypothetical protein